MFRILFALSLVCLTIVWLMLSDDRAFDCTDDIELGSVTCRLRCPFGYFSLPDMDECRSWLTCREVNSIGIVREIGSGAVKLVSVLYTSSSDQSGQNSKRQQFCTN